MALQSFSEYKKNFEKVDLTNYFNATKAAAKAKVEKESYELNCIFNTGVSLVGTVACTFIGTRGGRGGKDDSVEGPKEQLNAIFSKNSVTSLEGLQTKVTEKKAESDAAGQKAENSKSVFDQSNEKINGANGYAAQIQASESTINILNSTLKGLTEELSSLTASKPTNNDTEEYNNKVKALEEKIEKIKNDIKAEENKIVDLNDKIKAENLEEKKKTADADAVEANKILDEFRTLNADYQEAVRLNNDIRQKEGNVEGDVTDMKKQNDSRSEFMDAIKDKDLDNPTSDMVSAAEKWLDDNKEAPDDPSQRKAYDLCKQKAEKIIKNSNNQKTVHRNSGVDYFKTSSRNENFFA